MRVSAVMRTCVYYMVRSCACACVGPSYHHSRTQMARNHHGSSTVSHAMDRADHHVLYDCFVACDVVYVLITLYFRVQMTPTSRVSSPMSSGQNPPVVMPHDMDPPICSSMYVHQMLRLSHTRGRTR